jgi:CheY-like chemotaxis protein
MGADADALRLRFSVRDTGVGVPADKVADLFNAFEQADTSTTRRFGGTGLGLAITRRLALLMGGDVGVHTVQGQGSCFWFTGNFERASQPVVLDGIALPGRRVLVADDLPDARAALADLLRRLGMQVDSTDSGDEAVQAALLAVQRGRPYELLLLDAEMPGTDGLAALRQLQQRLGAAEMPPCLLIVDGDPARPPALDGLVGAVETLAKPLTLSALSTAIDKLDREPWQRPDHDRTEVLPNERALLQRATGQRVLLAEDNLINQEVARELLLAVGMKVDLANDGQEAVGLAAQRDYDLVLMDMQMPVMDGLDATRALRAMPRHARTPILAMTANAFGDDRRACLAAGMDDHIAKPVDPELLYGMLCRWLPARVDDGLAEHGRAGPLLPAVTGGVSTDVATGLGGGAGAGLADEPAPALGGRPPVPAGLGGAVVLPPPAPASAAPPAAPGMPDFSGIRGLTMSRALLYLPGRDQVFARVLRQFCDNYAQGVPGLTAALQAGQWVEAQRLLHALRGACGAVGATAVQAEALALEHQLQRLANGDTTNGDTTQAPGEAANRTTGASPAVPAGPSASPVLRTLQALVDTVQARLAAVADSTVAPPAPALQPGLQRLIGQLRRAEFLAGAQFRAIEAGLRAVLGDAAVQRLAQPLARHDYDTALNAAEALRSALGPDQ